MFTYFLFSLASQFESNTSNNLNNHLKETPLKKYCIDGSTQKNNTILKKKVRHYNFANFPYNHSTGLVNKNDCQKDLFIENLVNFCTDFVIKSNFENNVEPTSKNHEKIQTCVKTLEKNDSHKTVYKTEFIPQLNELENYIYKNNKLDKTDMKLYYETIIYQPLRTCVFARSRVFIKSRYDIIKDIVKVYIPCLLAKVKTESFSPYLKDYLFYRLIYIQKGFIYLMKFFMYDRVTKKDFTSLTKLYIQFYFEIDEFLVKFDFFKVYIEIYEVMKRHYKRNGIEISSKAHELFKCKADIETIYVKNDMLKKKILLCIIYMKNKNFI